LAALPIGRGTLTSLRGEPGLEFELGMLPREGSELRGTDAERELMSGAALRDPTSGGDIDGRELSPRGLPPLLAGPELDGPDLMPP
jgi:hypothetical protein